MLHSQCRGIEGVGYNRDLPHGEVGLEWNLWHTIMKPYPWMLQVVFCMVWYAFRFMQFLCVLLGYDLHRTWSWLLIKPILYKSLGSNYKEIILQLPSMFATEITVVKAPQDELKFAFLLSHQRKVFGKSEFTIIVRTPGPRTHEAKGDWVLGPQEPLN